MRDNSRAQRLVDWAYRTGRVARLHAAIDAATRSGARPGIYVIPGLGIEDIAAAGFGDGSFAVAARTMAGVACYSNAAGVDAIDQIEAMAGHDDLIRWRNFEPEGCC